MMDIAEILERDEPALVDDIVARMEHARPDLYARYSPEGPRRTREDVAFHLQHLRGALVADDPEIFRTYYLWLLSVLVPRGVGRTDIDLNFETMSLVLAQRYGPKAETPLEYIARATGPSPG